MRAPAAPSERATVVLGFVGTSLDRAARYHRPARWRPTLALVTHPRLRVSKYVLFTTVQHIVFAEEIANELRALRPEMEVLVTPLTLSDPWDFATVYGALHSWCRTVRFAPEREDYLVHITTGTHVCQICLYLLTESRHIPGRLLQTAPRVDAGLDAPAPGVGSVQIIDLDLSKYDGLAARFLSERREGRALLCDGIATRNEAFNAMIDALTVVAANSAAPILLTGPTGAGKSQLAARLHALRLQRHRVSGRFVDVNCATLRGDQAMSALFGHVKGAFTGANAAREGLLRGADGGTLFLDEVGELGLDEQAMLLRALEEKAFYPVGSDATVRSSFSLIAGTNRDLRQRVRAGLFREDLLARLDVWAFRLPSLAERPEDFEPNLDYELARVSDELGRAVSMNREAREAFVAFGRAAPWPGNFRELSAAVLRMATLAEGRRIDAARVASEVAGLSARWHAAAPGASPSCGWVERLLGPAGAASLDRFDRVQLEDVVAVCRQAGSLSEAGRQLFAASRAAKATPNDAARLRKYLARFGLSYGALMALDAC
ncbi:MAG: sigma 54-interacting transcriptional regulator [Myxococcales bacterium]|nr:sigma 54-interacting transcriptional regulator [Myxococcales bacterium]